MIWWGLNIDPQIVGRSLHRDILYAFIRLWFRAVVMEIPRGESNKYIHLRVLDSTLITRVVESIIGGFYFLDPPGGLGALRRREFQVRSCRKGKCTEGLNTAESGVA